MSKGLLIVSFGTSYHDAYENDIAPVEGALAAAFPDRVCVCAYGSAMIIRKLKSRDGITVPTVSEGLDSLLAQGVDDLLVQPTFLIPGIEFDRMVGAVEEKRARFAAVKIGAPLLSDDADFARVAACLQAVHSPRTGALLLMGHGTDHEANGVYARLEAAFAEAGFAGVFIGTVEGKPTLEDLLPRLAGYFHVTAAPLLLVAGDHARNDMAGDSDSWKTALQQAGHQVACNVRGLGSYGFIRELLVLHAKNAK